VSPNQANPRTQRLKGGVHRCRVRGCRSVKKTTRACISHGACMQGALHPFTAKALQTTTTKSHRGIHPAIRRHPSNHTSPPAESGSRGLSLPYGRYRLLHLTPHHADRPDSAMTVVVRHHPIEAPLQPSRLRRVFHLPCVQHLHKSKLIPAIVASSAPVLHSRKRARNLRASV
jgi:hypothetical protein